MTIPTYTEKDLNDFLLKIEEFYYDEYGEEDRNRVFKKLMKIRLTDDAPERIVKLFMGESYDIQTFHRFVIDLGAKKGLAIELLGWAYYYEDSWDT